MRALTVVCLLPLVPAPLPGVTSPAGLHLVDDREKPLGAPVTVCYQLERENQCAPLAAGAVSPAPPGFRGVRVEGDGHGPAFARREQLVAIGSGGYRLRVPRKGLLAVAPPLPAAPLTVSLYDARDEEFRTPAFRAALPTERVLRVPAGDFLLSLSEAGQAPDLRLVSVAPAARVDLGYERRPGWSLVVRVRQSGTRQPVTRARVSLQGSGGFGQGPMRTAVTRSEGLAVFTGLLHALASVTVRHPAHVPRDLYGITASPGTFGYSEAWLETGGTVRARVTLSGKPAAGARCLVLDFARQRVAGQEASTTLYDGRTDRGGICTTTPLASGRYTLRVALVEGDSSVERAVAVLDNQASEVDVDLVPIRLTGNVTRGGRPVLGYRVEVTPAGDLSFPTPKAEAEPAVEATTDADGRYEAILWAPGDYVLMPYTPSGAPAALFRQVMLEAEEESVDFDLAAAAVRGRVADPKGRPLPGAFVTLKEAGLVRRTNADADGSFEFPVDGAGPMTLRAFKPGFRLAEPYELLVPPDGSPPPVVLVMTKASVLQGSVVSAAGLPIAGGQVTAVPSRRSGANSAHHALTDTAGKFEVEIPPETAMQLFVNGPGCPLTVHQVSAGAGETVLTCPESPAAVSLGFRDSAGQPVPHVAVRLRTGATVVPLEVLGRHLAGLGVPAESDGSGRLVLVGLAPGSYEVFFADSSSEETVELGLPHGYATSVTLAPLSLVELEVTRSLEP